METQVNDIICADSYKWIRKQPDASIDAIITDYPYGNKWLDESFRVCRGNVITFCAAEDFPFKPSERAYWIKTPSTKNYSRHLGRFVEHIFIHRGEDGVFNADLHWSNYTGVYGDLVDEPNGHQFVKPLSLMERLVRIYTKPGDVVLDPFCGSGRVLQACENLGRRYIGIDIDEKWVLFCRESLRYASR